MLQADAASESNPKEKLTKIQEEDQKVKKRLLNVPKMAECAKGT
jgi:hypothetical protein